MSEALLFVVREWEDISLDIISDGSGLEKS